jgi:hypothetical protein
VVTYSASIAFLAVPGIIDVTQFFVIGAIGLSIASVVMGFNPNVEEKLAGLEQIELDAPQ